MPYTKQTWIDLPTQTTPLSAARLNYMEEGIETATELAEAADGVGITASDVAYVPTSGVDATTVQDAIAEVVFDFNQELIAYDASKVSKAGDTMSGPLVIEIAGSSTPLVVRHDSNGEVQVAITQTAIEFDDTAGGGFIVLEKNASDQLTVNGDAVATEDYVDAVGFDELDDVDASAKVDGSIAVWDEGTGKWTALANLTCATSGDLLAATVSVHDDATGSIELGHDEGGVGLFVVDGDHHTFVRSGTISATGDISSTSTHVDSASPSTPAEIVVDSGQGFSVSIGADPDNGDNPSAYMFVGNSPDYVSIAANEGTGNSFVIISDATGQVLLQKDAALHLLINGDVVATEDYVDALAFDGLTDVDPTGKVPGSIFYWDAVDGTYNPSPLNVASDGTTDLVASQDADVLRLHIGSSPAGFSLSASNDGEDTSQQLQVNATGVYVNALLVATEAAASGIAASAVSTHAGATDPHGDRAYADGLFASNDALLFKGVIDCSANPDYPAASAGHTYKISVAGKLGGASGVSVEVGDTAICGVDNTLTGSQALVGANWFIIQANLDGAVTGPASSTSGNVATFSGTGGKVIQDSGVALGNAASKNVGTTAGTVAAGDDSRFSDTRTPSDDSVTSAKIVNGAVTNADMADMTAKTVKMRHTNSTGAPEDTSMANLLADASGQAGADFSFNTHKVTGVTEGAAAGEAATYAATPAGIVTAKGDLVFGTGSHTVGRSAAPTNNKFWCADSNQSNGFTAVDLPWLQKVDVLRDLPYSATGFASQLAIAGNYAQMTALNDEAVFYLQFGAGTWSFNCWRTTFSSYGILTCSIDGTTIATLDNYSGGSVNPGQSTTTGISITVPGVYAFKIKTTSKNASSSGYNQRIWGLSFTRTA